MYMATDYAVPIQPIIFNLFSLMAAPYVSIHNYKLIGLLYPFHIDYATFRIQASGELHGILF